MTRTKKSFSGKCPQCQGYHTRIRTEVISYGTGAGLARHVQPPVISRTRVYFCNACQHVWTETVEPIGLAA